APSETVATLSQAIRVLNSFPVLDQVEPLGWERALSISREVLDLKHRMEKEEEIIRVTGLEIARIQEFGQFSLDDIRYIEREGHRKVQFFCAKKGFFDDKEMPPEMLFISSDHGLDYFVAINDSPRTYDKMVEMQFDRSLDALKEERAAAERRLDQLDEKIKPLQAFNSYLHKALLLALNVKNLKDSEAYTKPLLEGSLFSVEGWVPVNKVQEIEALCREWGVFHEEIAIEEKDAPPTCLQNTGWHRVGEDLVHIYDTPSNTDKDPSLWVLAAFAFFFAMIVNDAGYGLVYSAIAAFILYKFPNATGAGKRFIKLMVLLCAACVVWGVLTTQFFGIEIAVDSPLRKVSVSSWLSTKKAEFYLEQKGETFKEWAVKYPAVAEAKDGADLWAAMNKTVDGKLVNEEMDGLGKGIMLELALLVGIIHLSLSFLRYLGRNWSGIGWIMVLIGGYLYFPHYLGETSLLQYAFGAPASFGEVEGLELIYGGIGLAVLLAVIQHRLGGLAEIMNLIQVFADVLSYLRLYALGLAGGIVSQTINELGAGLPLLIGIVLMIFAHAVNMGLGIMSGVIHGLRLNFLEWYHYSFEGGGKPYDPLRLNEVD
ncbi:MAG: V-type ATP synthase subunit I, partial [Chlamydiia bacterium]|nr:V-type ATP synthase subunit I [Chlamydiia bacterium]